MVLVLLAEEEVLLSFFCLFFSLTSKEDCECGTKCAKKGTTQNDYMNDCFFLASFRPQSSLFLFLSPSFPIPPSPFRPPTPPRSNFFGGMKWCHFDHKE
jgi:hypothetical protein